MKNSVHLKRFKKSFNELNGKTYHYTRETPIVESKAINQKLALNIPFIVCKHYVRFMGESTVSYEIIFGKMSLSDINSDKTKLSISHEQFVKFINKYELELEMKNEFGAIYGDGRFYELNKSKKQ